MAGTSLLILIDDIATILDDVALLTKVAAKKTTGVLGDDLALNAQQVSGVRAERELPVVWAVAKGSLRNKAILVPAALAISAFSPWAVTPLLMVGGLFLCFEGFEKIAHKLMPSHAADEARHHDLITALDNPKVDLMAYEKNKISGAIRTDFVLSAEIIAITLGTVAQAEFSTQLTVLSGIALIMTIGVYGLVAAIVKLDDGGLYLVRTAGPGGLGRAQKRVGEVIVNAAPHLMRLLTIAGTIAMFLVGGGILTHGIPQAHHWILQVADGIGTTPSVGGLLKAMTPISIDALTGILAGALTLLAVTLIQRLKGGAKLA